MRELELLAPAKDYECGMAAIDHGADAVYIGAPRFGARAQAGNSIADIARLCEYAHQFNAKVYVTVNTLLYDSELDDVRQLISELSAIHVDAILVQDMAIVRWWQESGGDWPVTLHASTQTDNRTPQKVAWLHSHGFTRVVLARELSLDEISEIHRTVPDVELEVFVHGALCVSYSGLCYASQHCFGRSANRGECAQFCRMKFDLIDDEGRELIHQRHLLSLKDLNQSNYLEQLAAAGATSFKIEGRLKNSYYVKNVTAAYSQLLDRIVSRHPDLYRRASRGRCTYTFSPDLERTFNRGYTNYFLHGRKPDMASFDTPKAIGQYVGVVKEVRGQTFTVSGIVPFANGDGLCFFNPSTNDLEGFRVNRVEGNRLFPQVMPSALRPGLRLYRNNDQEFERLLSKTSAERKIPVAISLRSTTDGFLLTIGEGTFHAVMEHQIASKPQRDNIIRQLTKLGNTPFVCTDIDIPADFNYFIPSSQLSEMRRQACLDALQSHAPGHNVKHPSAPVTGGDGGSLYLYANDVARRFYADQGLSPLRPTYELQPSADIPIMQCRYCIRHALGFCGTSQHRSLSLRLADGRVFPLKFDCKNCQMNVYGNS